MSVRRRTPGPGPLPRDPEPAPVVSPGAPNALSAAIRTWPFTASLLAALLLVLHGRYLLWPFVSDDLVFADASRKPAQLFSTFHQYSNYFRPIGRELYFYVGHVLAGRHPLPYHVVNFVVLLGVVLLVAALA